ncbi:MAG: hypothetical protein Kow0073_12400 [Immundisolibacter sp.]
MAPPTYDAHTVRRPAPDRRLEGSASARTDFVPVAPEQAPRARKPFGAHRLIHHSDRVVQYVSIRYTGRLAAAGIDPPVGCVGEPYGNAPRDHQPAIHGRDDPPVPRAWAQALFSARSPLGFGAIRFATAWCGLPVKVDIRPVHCHYAF